MLRARSPGQHSFPEPFSSIGDGILMDYWPCDGILTVRWIIGRGRWVRWNIDRGRWIVGLERWINVRIDYCITDGLFGDALMEVALYVG